VTAANSSSISDGAAALVLSRARAAEAKGLTIRARILGHASHAQAPVAVPDRPGPAARKLLDRIGWSVDDVDLWEVNEAFAVVPMAFMQELGVPREKMNVNGGACALGHPDRRLGRADHGDAPQRAGGAGSERGVAAICIGGGEGTAIAIERSDPFIFPKIRSGEREGWKTPRSRHQPRAHPCRSTIPRSPNPSPR
jgi:acetyl-CoA C-acetyltransferase